MAVITQPGSYPFFISKYLFFHETKQALNFDRILSTKTITELIFRVDNSPLQTLQHLPSSKIVSFWGQDKSGHLILEQV